MIDLAGNKDRFEKTCKDLHQKRRTRQSFRLVGKKQTFTQHQQAQNITCQLKEVYANTH